MSDLVLSNNSDDMFAQLAAEFGITPETEVDMGGGGRIYTNMTTVENIRVLKAKSWQDGFTFQWNYPGQEDIEEFGDDFPLVHELKGFIVHSEIQPALSVKNDDPDSERASRTICSVVGYKKGDNYVKELPEKVPFNSMYDGWDSEKKHPIYTNPARGVEELGLLGSRGKSCADCIKCGDSIQVDETGEVLGECSLKGRIFFYVTDVIRYKKTMVKGGEPKVERIEKSIKDILSEEELNGAEGIIVMISLPNKVGLKGNWDRKDESKKRIAYLSYLTGLSYKYKKSHKVSPRMVCTTISIKPPVADTKNTKNFLEFTEVETFDFLKLRSGLQTWETLKPREEPIPLEADRWVINGKGGSTVYASASVDTTPLLNSSDDYPEVEALAEDTDEDEIF